MRKPPEWRLPRLSRVAPLLSFPRRPAEILRPPQLRRIPERRRAVAVLTPGLCSCALCYLLSSQRESWGLLGEPPSAAIYVCLRLFASAARIFLIVCAVRSDTSACIVPANCL